MLYNSNINEYLKLEDIWASIIDNLDLSTLSIDLYFNKITPLIIKNSVLWLYTTQKKIKEK